MQHRYTWVIIAKKIRNNTTEFKLYPTIQGYSFIEIDLAVQKFKIAGFLIMIGEDQNHTKCINIPEMQF